MSYCKSSLTGSTDVKILDLRGSLHCSPFQIHIVDGARLVESPWEEMTEVENFLGIPNKLSRKNFTFDKEMGVHPQLF